jgi:hypothetical protein
VLIVFLVVATSLYHNLFMFQGKERDPHIYLTLVNITLCGGLLGAGPAPLVERTDDGQRLLVPDAGVLRDASGAAVGGYAVSAGRTEFWTDRATTRPWDWSGSTGMIDGAELLRPAQAEVERLATAGVYAGWVLIGLLTWAAIYKAWRGGDESWL